MSVAKEGESEQEEVSGTENLEDLTTLEAEHLYRVI